MSKEPLRARRRPLIFIPHFQLYPTGSTSGLFPPSAPAFERCIDRSESRHLLSASRAIFLHQQASGLSGRLQNAAFNIGHWPATGLRPKPMPHQTRQSTNFSARASRRSLATERVSISRPIAGWIFAREIQHRAQPFGLPNLQIGSSRLAGYGLPPMMRSIPLR